MRISLNSIHQDSKYISGKTISFENSWIGLIYKQWLMSIQITENRLAFEDMYKGVLNKRDKAYKNSPQIKYVKYTLNQRFKISSLFSDLILGVKIQSYYHFFYKYTNNIFFN